MSQRIANDSASLARAADAIRALESRAEDQHTQLRQAVQRLDASQMAVNAAATLCMIMMKRAGVLGQG